MTCLILRAAQFAEQAHRGQKRDFTGGPYIDHPARVAMRVAMRPDATEEMVAAAFLHDVVEDTETTHETIERLFGPRVRTYVQYLTNPSKERPDLRRAERKEMDRNWLKTAPPEVQVIKMLDRVDNLNEMVGAKEDFKRLYSSESLLLADVIGNADIGLRNELVRAAKRLMG